MIRYVFVALVVAFAAAGSVASAQQHVESTLACGAGANGSQKAIIRACTEMIQSNPGSTDAALSARSYAFFMRAMAYHSEARYKDAIADLTETIRIASLRRIKGARIFAREHRCFDRAIIGDLQPALEDCNAALRVGPLTFALQSRAFTNYRLGRYADALKDCNAILEHYPKDSASLYLRGLTRERLGDRAGGQADVAAAKAIQPDIASEYARYGI